VGTSRFTLWLTAFFFSRFFLTLPRLVRRWVPHSSGVLSITFLYIFAQALGLLWLLVVNLGSVCSVQLVGQIQEFVDGRIPDAFGAIRLVLRGYVHYCTLRILFFIAVSLYTVGWEAFSDFPMVRRLVAGSESRNRGSQKEPPHRLTGFNSAPNLASSQDDESPKINHRRAWERSEFIRQTSEESNEPTVSSPDRLEVDVTHASAACYGAHRRRRRRFFREATLLAPLLGLIAVAVGLSVVSLLYQVYALPESDALDSLANPTGRINRGFRFAVFVSFMQWMQQFVYLFPRWNRGLLASRLGRAWGLVAMLLLPVALSRFFQWSLMPAGTGITQMVLGTMPHHAIDVGLLLSLKIWFFVCCFIVLQSPELSGFDRRRRHSEDEDWKEMAVLFKYTFILPTMLHFVRGSIKFGFVAAQNDLLVIVCAYPLLLVTVWTIVWAVVVAPGKWLLLAGVAGSLALTSAICTIVGLHKVGAAVVIWLHLMRQYLKFFKARKAHARSTARQRNVAAKQRKFPRQISSTQPSSQSESEAINLEPDNNVLASPERKYAWAVILIGFLIIVGFTSLLVFLTMVASLQQKVDWYPTTVFFEREEDPLALRVDHVVSRLRLHTRDEQAGVNSSVVRNQSKHGAGKGGVSYAVCAHLWHGLSVLDYALLSLAAYFDPADPGLQGLLAEIFPSGVGLSWRLRSAMSSRPGPPSGSSTGSRLSWLDVEVKAPGMQQPILVISLRGTDPVRVHDYVEDIRMWTEPVALSMLSTVFPTIRAWPRHTVEMVVVGIHDFLGALGMPDDSWSYMELVRHISTIPRDNYAQIVLTGHSLGGGMATVVAALTHLPVISITPPGIYWTLAKHHRSSGRNWTLDSSDGPLADSSDISSWMHHESLTLIVENDWVNRIFDDHGGLVQMMTCDRSQESLELACHMLEGTICHIFDRCGDPLQRWDRCTHEYALKDTIKDTMLSTATNVLSEVVPVDLESMWANLWDWQGFHWPISLFLFVFIVPPTLEIVFEEVVLL